MSSSERSDDEKRFVDAARYGRLAEVIELSNKFRNDVKVLNEALIISCRLARLDVVKWLAGHTAANVNTSLAIACDYDNLDMVKYFVETCHANVNLGLPNRGGKTLLTMACHNVSVSVSMYLLREVSNLDVNMADSDDDTALHLVVWLSKNNGNTQLHEACVKGDVTEVLKLVYVRGHKINVQNNRGNTPLHLACDNGHNNIVETLMLAGADETITNDRRKTPAHVAVSWEHSEPLKTLDRVSLWPVMLWRRNKLKLSLVMLMMLTVRVMRQKQMTGSWCHTLTAVHIMFTVRNIINFNRIKRHKLKRKIKCII